MCGLCGLIAEQRDWSDSVAFNVPKRQERYRKIMIINTIVKYYRVSVSDFQGLNYLLQNQTGKASVVNGLNHLWEEIEAMTHQSIDVLDERFLNDLTGKINA